MKSSLLLVTLLTTIPAAHAKTQCEEASTQLFGQPLACATRTTFRAALKKAGAHVKREDNHYLCDLYDPTGLLDGADKLAVCYAHDDALAVVSYRVPAFVDPGKVMKVRSLIASKYGKPQRSSGNPRLGRVMYEWDQPNRVSIAITRGWPDTTVFLEFRPQAPYADFLRMVDDDKKAKEAEAAARQADAF